MLNLFKKKYFILKCIGKEEYYSGNLQERTERRGNSIWDIYTIINWETTTWKDNAYKFSSKKEAKIISEKLENKFIIKKMKGN